MVAAIAAEFNEYEATRVQPRVQFVKQAAESRRFGTPLVARSTADATRTPGRSANPAARAGPGEGPRAGPVSPAAAPRTAMPARSATAGDLDDIGGCLHRTLRDTGEGMAFESNQCDSTGQHGRKKEFTHWRTPIFFTWRDVRMDDTQPYCGAQPIRFR